MEPDTPANGTYSNSNDTEIYIPETGEQGGTASGSDSDSDSDPVETVLPDSPVEEPGSGEETSGEETGDSDPAPAPDFDPDGPEEGPDDEEALPDEAEGPASETNDGMDQADGTEASAIEPMDPAEAEGQPSASASTFDESIRD